VSKGEGKEPKKLKSSESEWVGMRIEEE